MIDSILGFEFDERRRRISNLLIASHRNACVINNHNFSSVTYAAFIESGVSQQSALASAILSTGGAHAPIKEAYDFLFNSRLTAEHLLGIGKKVPGYGNSVHKDRIDPAFNGLVEALEDTEEWRRVDDVFQQIKILKKKELFPNAAAITAAALSQLGLSPEYGIWYFIAARLPIWINNTL